jgi:hypothetical protein
LRLPALVCALALGLTAVGPAPAAELVLTNGDRLTGRVVSREGDRLSFETAWGGVLAIPWEHVARLTTDAPVLVVTEDDTLLRGRLDLDPEAGLRVVPEDGEPVAVDEAAVAAFNPEAWQLGTAIDYGGHVALALMADRGPSDTDEVDVDGDFTARRGDDRVVVRGDLEYDKADGDTTKNRWQVLGKLEHFTGGPWYVAVNAFVERDTVSGLQHRYHVGPALGYQFFEGEERNLKAEAGLYYTVSDFSDSGRSESVAAGWLVDYDQWLGARLLQVYHTQAGIVANDENMSFKSKTGLRFPVTGGFHTAAEVEANWDAETAGDADEVELIYRLKAGYGW